ISGSRLPLPPTWTRSVRSVSGPLPPGVVQIPSTTPASAPLSMPSARALLPAAIASKAQRCFHCCSTEAYASALQLLPAQTGTSASEQPTPAVTSAPLVLHSIFQVYFRCRHFSVSPTQTGGCVQLPLSVAESLPLLSWPLPEVLPLPSGLLSPVPFLAWPAGTV